MADFSAIEARVLSCLAGEKWRMEVFAKNGDIYCETASRMFGVPVEKHGINGHLRQKGKQQGCFDLCHADIKELFYCGHVHDEIIIEADKRMSLEAVCEQMGRTPPWAKGLILNADGYECEFYKKD